MNDRQNSVFDLDEKDSTDDKSDIIDSDLSDDYEFRKSLYALDGSEESDVERLVANATDEIKASRVADRLEREQAGTIAKQAFKQVYDEDFDLDSPPESLDRYERIITLRRLEEAAIRNSKFESEILQKRNHDLPNTEHAIQCVSIMETYGELAENNLARVASATVSVPEVRKAAADALERVREDAKEQPSMSLREALAAWLRPGGES